MKRNETDPRRRPRNSNRDRYSFTATIAIPSPQTILRTIGAYMRRLFNTV